VLNWFAVALVYCGLIGMLTGAVSVARPIRVLGHQTRLSAVAFFSASAPFPQAPTASAATKTKM